MACIVAAARVVDLWSTRVITPDLAGEQNVVLEATEGGWLALIALSLLLVLATATLFATALRLQPKVRPRRLNLRLASFWRHAIWGRPRPLRDLFSIWPPGRRWLWAVGRFLPCSIVATSLTAAAGNLGAYWWPAFRPAWALMVGNPVSQVFVLVAAILVAGLAWVFLEHARYRAAARSLDRT